MVSIFLHRFHLVPSQRYLSSNSLIQVAICGNKGPKQFPKKLLMPCAKPTLKQAIMKIGPSLVNRNGETRVENLQTPTTEVIDSEFFFSSLHALLIQLHRSIVYEGSTIH